MQIKKLKLSFKDEKGKTKMVNIDHPKADLNDQVVKTQMEAMINSKVLQTKEGKISSINKAYMESVSREDFNLG